MRFLDLNALLREMEKMLNRLLGEDTTIILDLAPDLGMVRADQGQIEQVIIDLMSGFTDDVISHHGPVPARRPAA